MKLTRAFSVFASALAAVAVALGPACSSQPCNADPFQCGGGQTCGLVGPDVYSCIASGPGARGTSCLSTTGVASCSQGLICIDGACVAFCDSKHPCPSGTSCQSAS